MLLTIVVVNALLGALLSWYWDDTKTILSFVLAGNDLLVSSHELDDTTLRVYISRQQQEIAHNMASLSIQIDDTNARRRAEALGKWMRTRGYWSLFDNNKLVRLNSEIEIHDDELVAYHGSFGLGVFETSTMIVGNAMHRDDLNFSYTLHTTQRSLIDGRYEFSFATLDDILIVRHAKHARVNDDVVYPIRRLISKDKLIINNENSCREFVALCEAFILRGSSSYTHNKSNGPNQKDEPEVKSMAVDAFDQLTRRSLPRSYRFHLLI